MKMIILMAAILVGLAVSGMAADAGGKEKKAKKAGPVKHMVAFKFKDGTSKDDIAKLVSEFKGLKKKIDVIRSFDAGENNSPEGLNKGCTHGWLLTFDTPADRDTYLHHPDHAKFGELAKSMLADVFVLDFVSAK